MSLIISADFHREKKHISRHDTTPLGLAPLPQHQGTVRTVRTFSKALSLSLVRVSSGNRGTFPFLFPSQTRSVQALGTCNSPLQK